MGTSFNLVVDDEQRPVKIVNLTPHPVTLTSSDESVELPPCKNPARLQTEREPIATLDTQLSPDGERISIPVVRESSNGVEHLPPEDPNTILLVSRLIMDAHPNRLDLMCPTDLERDSYGQITGAKALVSSRNFAKPEPDHLVVPFGMNPMPLFQSIVTLKPKKVTALVSDKTSDVCDRLKEVLMGYHPDTIFDTKHINDVDDAKEIQGVLRNITPRGWALCFIGGTKAMSAYSRLLYDTLGDGRPRYVSLVQNRSGSESCIVSEDGNQGPLSEGRYTLADIAKLHGRYFEKRSEVPEWSEIELFKSIFERLLDDPKPKVAEDEIPDRQEHSAIAHYFNEDIKKQKKNAKGGNPDKPTGFWFEALVGAVFRRSLPGSEMLASTHLIPFSDVKPNQAKPKPGSYTELDLVVRDGWKIALISCTVDRSKARIKQKLMEAQQRARQFGGDHTHAMVASLADKHTCEAVKKDIGSMDGERIAVYGIDDVRQWLAGKNPKVG